MKIFDEYCTTTMQNRLQQHPEFASKLVDNPIETLKAIELLTHNPVRVVYSLEAITDALKNFLLARQNKRESTMDYIKRRKQIGATVLQFLGPNFLEYFIKSTEWYEKATEIEKKNLLEQSYQLWQSYLLVRNGEKEQFGDLLDHLQKQFALGTDQFPKNVMKAADVMGAHEAQKGREKKQKTKN